MTARVPAARTAVGHVYKVTRGEAIRRYARDLAARPDLLAQLPELRGLRLACWCHTFDQRPGASPTTLEAGADAVCHGDVLAWLADRWDGRTPSEAWARRVLTRWLERSAAPAPPILDSQPHRA